MYSDTNQKNAPKEAFFSVKMEGGLYSRMQEGSGACRRPGSSSHRAAALDCPGSAHRAGWFRGSFIEPLRCSLPAGQTSSGVGQPTIGRPFYGQAKSQLRLTWRPSAGSSQKRRISVHGVSDSWGSKCQSAGRHQTYSIPESKRVQAPSAPGFYRSCAAH
jgi:hypothetical protein